MMTNMLAGLAGLAESPLCWLLLVLAVVVPWLVSRAERRGTR